MIVGYLLLGVLVAVWAFVDYRRRCPLCPLGAEDIVVGAFTALIWPIAFLILVSQVRRRSKSAPRAEGGSKE
jgi:hypothetical protein